MTFAELAAAAGVSQPTVMRFTNAVGCDGFHQLRIELAQSVALGISATQSAISPDEDVPTTISKIFDYSISSLDHTRRHLDADQVGLAIDALVTAGDILFLGLGASGIVALDAEQKFPLFGKPCSAPVDHHQQFLAASLAGTTTAVVAISNVGRTRSVLGAVELAKQAGATTIAITGGLSPLADAVDIPIIVASLDNTDVYTPTISRLSQLVVIDVLATSVMLRRDPSELDKLRHVKNKLSRMRAGLDYYDNEHSNS
jgi:DNA-binding MurR/RpiR family transcriptional regulator